MLGNTYCNGALVVIGWDAETRVATVRCRCNNVDAFKLYSLVSGKVTCCRTCKHRAEYLRSITIDLKLLEDVKPSIAAKIVRAFAEHLRACERNNVPATSFAICVHEMLADGDLAKDDEPSSFEDRFLASNFQRYHVYESPAQLI